MTDFSTEALLYPFTKGDFIGHLFHGNQYSNGVDPIVRSAEKAEKIGKYRFRNGRWPQAVEEHTEAAKQFGRARDLERANGGSRADELDARVKDNEQRARTANNIYASVKRNQANQ